MPSLTFILPHWLYWSGLVVFPFVAIALVRRERRRGPGHGINLFTAYLFWLTAGFLGMHRFYLKSLWGFLFIPFFLAILWGNGHIRDAREDVSRTHFQHERALRAVERADSRVKAGRPGAAEAAATAREQEQQTKAALDVADGALSTWNHVTSGAAIALALLLLGDAALLPRAVRRAREREGDPRAEITVLPEAPMQGTVEATSAHVRTKFTDVIDGFNQSIGTYVAYWAVIAVFVYYYEVVARYVFNSPTNWVHESMFLMFGMQYLFCGAYAYREDSHVRVDVFYSKLSPRGKAMADIFTSLFFFIFIVTMFWTGMRFALDSVAVGEHSFTEWGVQYWPVKLALPIGAFLILLQGVSKLIKDIVFVVRGAEPGAAAPVGGHLGA